MGAKIAISEFKAHCLEILNKLEGSRSSITITKRNKPIAIVSPFSKKKKPIIGLMKDKGEIKGDIVSSFENEWELDK